MAESITGISFANGLAPVCAEITKEQKFQKILSHFQKRWRIPSLFAEYGNLEKRILYSSNVGEESIFPLASISKVITATQILLLAERHKLKLSDSICKYFDQFPESFQKITLNSLITHTSGLALSGGDAQNRATYIKSLAYAGLRFSPGERFEYNNPAYVLLGWIIERVSGKSLSACFEENIFAPLGMNHTSIPNNGFADYPEGHRWDKTKLVSASSKLEFQTMGGTGGVVSCTSDLAQFSKALLTNKVLNKDSLAIMFDATQLDSGRLSDSAFCWRLGKDYAGRVYNKNGNFEGFSTWLAVDPSKKSYLIALCNLGGVSFEDCSREVFGVV